MLFSSENKSVPGRWGREHSPPYRGKGGASLPLLGAPPCDWLWPTACHKPGGIYTSRPSITKK